MKDLTVSIVICTYNRADLLDLTLQAVTAQTVKPNEIIVVDNNSSDNTKDIVSQYQHKTDYNVIYHFEVKQGATVARNSGAHIATGDVIIFFDDDVIPVNTHVENVLKAFTSEKLDYAGGRIELKFVKERPAWLDDRLCGILATCNYGNTQIDFPCTGKQFPISANIAIRKEVFQAVNGFTPNELHNYKWSKPCNDDILFGMKVHHAGFKLTYLPDASVLHLIPEERTTVSYYKSCFYFYGIADIIHKIIPASLTNHMYILLRSMYRIIAGFVMSKFFSNSAEKHWQLFRIYYNSGLIQGIIKYYFK